MILVDEEIKKKKLLLFWREFDIYKINFGCL